jgi:hexosaminidase
MKTCLLFGLLLSVTVTTAQQVPVRLIPQPVRVVPGSGTFGLTRNTAITFAQPAAADAAAILTAQLTRSTGFGLVAKPAPLPADGTIHYALTTRPDTTLGREGYRLTVAPRRVVLTANTPAGLFYATQTLLQLLPPDVESRVPVAGRAWLVPVVQITDYPRFGWRGLMLDVSRHFFTVAEVKQYIDQLVRFKFNTFHWHLTDDQGWRVEIKALPRLTSVGAWRVPRMGQYGQIAPPKPGEAATDGGFYTQADIREVVRYAQERHVTIVPEIDVPGHAMAAVAAYPDLACSRDTNTRVNAGSKFVNWQADATFTMDIDNSLNPASEGVYVFLDQVFAEIAALFPGPYIHVGGDECNRAFWAKDAGCQALMAAKGYRNADQLQAYFTGRVEQLVQKHGKKMLGWEAILEGDLSATSAVMIHGELSLAAQATRRGQDVVMTPGNFTYLDLMQGDPTVEPPIYNTSLLKTGYTYDPVPDGADARHILGGQANLWTEDIATLHHAEYMAWPRGYALAEVYWSPKSARDWPGFIPRMEAQFVRHDRAGINYSRAAYDAVIRPTLEKGALFVALDPQIPGLTTYYSFDGSVPGRYSPIYTTGPIAVPEGPVTLRVITYRDGQPAGRLLTVKRDDLQRRVKKP